MTLTIAVEKPTAPKGAPVQTSEAALNAVADVLETVTSSLDDSKALDIVTIDIAGKSALGDHMVIASGRSHRHVGAIADQLLRALKDHGVKSPRVEGMPNCDWVLVDVGDVIIHIFRPEVREFYGLEKMWQMPDHQEAH